ncbi:MAG: phenylalanine--tRNA ligase subunit beta [Acholeplasmataceae bacterium]|jgi:phenylalanyl-tRNA synthetase beta chain|nr:phenylalanine--tRNA ligase subunit beta [Acholeplasmataceae bacterium]
MKIIESILKNWIEVPANIYELTNQKIIEVESFKLMNEATNLVIGKVLTCEDHPNSDHLHVTTVDLGDRVEQIVCGAPNVGKDQYVIVAQVGTVLPGDFQIKASKIRGVESNGMICSLHELGLEESLIPDDFKDGIFYFDQPKTLGKPALPELALEGFVMELKLTPNRADLLSHVGFAYDLASMTGSKIKKPNYQISESDKKNPIKVTIETKGCGLYHARHFENIKVKESPWWLKNALMASDIHPINNVVDISNYVLIEYGTPLHMFDYDKLQSDHILVRSAKENEEVVTLDDEKRVLKKSDVVITNTKEVIAIGGVMGLKNTMIDDLTTSVVLEAAYFDPKTIQKTVKRLGLRSESSLRFERGVDPSRVIEGMHRATELMIELAEAKVSSGITTTINAYPENKEVRVPKTYFNEALGVHISENELLNYFDAYQYQYRIEGETYILKAPSYRNDLEIKADYLEEIARMYGLDRIPTTPFDKPLPGSLSFKQKRLRHIRHHLANLGLYEAITYSLLDQNDVHLYNIKGEPVSILMPLSEDKKTLRQSLVHGLLETISFNQSRRVDDVAVFEIGNCFAKDQEDLHLALAMSGVWHENPWQKNNLKPDFYLVKGLLESIFKPLGIAFKYQASQKVNGYHPYRQAEIYYKDHVIGTIAELHPSEEKRLGIDHTVIAEINLKHLLNEKQDVMYEAVSKYPSVTRDLAIVIDEDITAQSLIDLISQTVRKNLVSIDVFDVYQGSHIEKGKKSMAFSLVLNDKDKTLSADDVEQLMKKIINRLTYTYKAVIRN